MRVYLIKEPVAKVPQIVSFQSSSILTADGYGVFSPLIIFTDREFPSINQYLIELSDNAYAILGRQLAAMFANTLGIWHALFPKYTYRYIADGPFPNWVRKFFMIEPEMVDELAAIIRDMINYIISNPWQTLIDFLLSIEDADLTRDVNTLIGYTNFKSVASEYAMLQYILIRWGTGYNGIGRKSLYNNLYPKNAITKVKRDFSQNVISYSDQTIIFQEFPQYSAVTYVLPDGRKFVAPLQKLNAFRMSFPVPADEVLKGGQ